MSLWVYLLSSTNLVVVHILSIPRPTVPYSHRLRSGQMATFPTTSKFWPCGVLTMQSRPLSCFLYSPTWDGSWHPCRPCHAMNQWITQMKVFWRPGVFANSDIVIPSLVTDHRSLIQAMMTRILIFDIWYRYDTSRSYLYFCSWIMIVSMIP